MGLMPVVFERGGREARCLEIRLDWQCPSNVSVVLAYRTDGDRQGESGDVVSWPRWKDPRTTKVLNGLLSGFASKLCRFGHPQMAGFSKSLRMGVQWMRQRKYPTKYWLRPLGLALLRFGAPLRVTAAMFPESAWVW